MLQPNTHQADTPEVRVRYLSPVVFIRLAGDYREAAEREFANSAAAFCSPGYFLISRSIELALKSFLLYRGADEAELRRVSHDLERGLAKAAERKLGEFFIPTAEFTAAVQMVNGYYRDKDLEYPKTGYAQYPQPHYLLSCATELIAALDPPLRKWRPTTDGKSQR